MKTIKEFKIDVYEKGIVNTIEDTLIPDGAASYSRNFITLPDRIELAAGRRLLGAEETGNKQILGMGSITKVDGTELLLRKIDTILQYFNTTTQLWVNIKTGMLSGEKLSFANSFTPAGRQVWMCGQDGLFKLYPSNPTDSIDLTDATKNYKGQIIIDKSRMICIGMKEDPTGIRFSKVDKDSNYTNVSAEAISSETASHYTGTLAKTQVFGLAFTKGAQVLRDDKNGNLTGDGTGIINYATGAYVLDFTTSNATAVTCGYLWEDPLTNGLADFRYSATRLAAEGNIMRQDSTGAKSQVVVNFNNTFYTLQNKGCWRITIDTTDLTWDNQIYRTNIGCPSSRGAVATADGIIFIDTYNLEQPVLRVLEFNQLGDKIIPTALSNDFRLEDFTFDEDTALYRKGNWILIACKEMSTENDAILIYNTKQKSFDVVEYNAICFQELYNKIIAGDSTSPNTYELFTGTDDLDYNITGSWKGKKHNQKTDYLKKFKRFRLNGYIDKDQEFEVYAEYDNDTSVLLGTVYGTEVYVDEGKRYLIGEDRIGEELIGLGDSSEASYFETEFKVRTPKYRRVKISFVPIKTGYFSVLEHKFSDIRIKSSKIPKKYKTGIGSGIGSMKVGPEFEIA